MYKHGKKNTRLYNIWKGMKQRCYNTSNLENIKNYKERNISVCDEWRDDFVNFYNWALENGYKDNLTIDRIDVNGNYEPNNCRWSDIKEQSRNKRNTIYIKIDDKEICLLDYLESINREEEYDKIRTRLKRGWDFEEAFNCPQNLKRHYYSFLKFLMSEFENKSKGHYILKKDFVKKYMDNWEYSNRLATYFLNSYIIEYMNNNNIKNYKNQLKKE